MSEKVKLVKVEDMGFLIFVIVAIAITLLSMAYTLIRIDRNVKDIKVELKEEYEEEN